MLAQISCFPTDRGASVSEYVAGSIKLIRESGLDYKLGPMSTTVEGPPDEVFELIKKVHLAMRDKAERVYTVVSIDDRKDAEGRIKGKIESIEKKLDGEVNS